ncbi:GGDEF domain-containing protein [Paenibacillus hemerocallicola]|uniref:GGDEF domain-containing protein n=1 Tax=Paenibacillus hemerocallicola TaxID=1172614 RepID=A0A5C4T854_9BACL|nr:GGDEF domain-containing protein [Paenibacillus hemerocallicola]TNJ65264.1 GGDEF domain-containing protein [Paenibacillus hemerocallicola]
MNVSELFVGAYARIYTYSGILVVLAMILVMSVRLFTSRRRKAYVSLTLSVAAFIVHYAMMISMSLSIDGPRGWGGLAAQTLHVVAFIMINRAIYQLYNSTKKRHHLYFYFSLLVTMLLAAFQTNVPRLFEGSPEQLAALGRIGLDLYLLLLVFVFFIGVPDRIGQTATYKIGLSVFFIVHLAHLINRYMLESPLSALTLTELYLPLLYYIILFVLLFERIVELMQASYRTAITDGLTGLYNRRYMLSKAAQYMRHGYAVSLLFSDIDNFKKLNDTQGHHAGDEALKAVARIMLEESEDIGLAGRFGGEEMVLLVTDSSVDIAKLSEKVRARIESEAGVTVSIGYSKSRNGITAEQLIAQADQAMYKAKTTGKNKVVKYVQSKGAAAN